MYNNPYYQSIYNPQSNIDRINTQIAELEKMKQQIQQPVQQSPITQNFQLAPTNHGIRFVDTIDDVNKEVVYYDTPFFSKDMSVVWIKNLKGDIKSYELNEIIPKDSKDLQIEFLQSQIEELKGKIENDANVTNVNAKQNTTNTSAMDSTNGEEFESNKSTSVSKIQRGKKEQ